MSERISTDEKLCWEYWDTNTRQFCHCDNATQDICMIATLSRRTADRMLGKDDSKLNKTVQSWKILNHHIKVHENALGISRKTKIPTFIGIAFTGVARSVSRLVSRLKTLVWWQEECWYNREEFRDAIFNILDKKKNVK